ncbi:hypothetical protein [Spirosoma validum]|uniref:Uncharacterized protein n=1 Tax=Spirosoma validum TaxID=2771355 RepID=A0A927GC69_9BACT|nr:hypothetical protein [Spirosoma validum]MBD2752452.1 hypothetical protein [Spirosoma validum]
MMKRYLLIILLGLAVFPVCGQGVTDYYRAPDQGQQYSRLLTRYGGSTIQNRWYVALEGFVRTDRAQLDNSFNGLIESDRVTRLGGSAVIGWVYRERWAVEAGYAQMPIHTQVSVVEASSPLTFRYTNAHSAFVLRGKRLVLSTSKPWLRSGFWLSGGLWGIPNNGQREGSFSISGTRYLNMRETRVPVQLVGHTSVNGQPTTLAEVGAEYAIRLSSAVDLGFSVRKFFGLGNSITTDVSYAEKQGPVQQAQLQGDGTGMSYGTTLRYTFSTRRKMTSVLDVQGKKRSTKFL